MVAPCGTPVRCSCCWPFFRAQGSVSLSLARRVVWAPVKLTLPAKLLNRVIGESARAGAASRQHSSASRQASQRGAGGRKSMVARMLASSELHRDRALDIIRAGGRGVRTGTAGRLVAGGGRDAGLVHARAHARRGVDGAQHGDGEARQGRAERETAAGHAAAIDLLLVQAVLDAGA